MGEVFKMSKSYHTKQIYLIALFQSQIIFYIWMQAVDYKCDTNVSMFQKKIKANEFKSK